MLTKEAIENTLMDMDVSLRMLILRWVMWYNTVRVWFLFVRDMLVSVVLALIHWGGRGYSR